MHIAPRAVAAGCLAALALPLTIGVPAAGAPLERERIVYHEDFVVECGGLAFPSTVSGTLNLLVVERGRSGLPHFNGTFHETSVYTHPETGRSYTGTFNGSNRDQSVTDNGDGTLSLIVQLSGAWKWYDADGKLLYRDTGMTRFELRVDHGGTPSDPSDDGDVEFVGELKELTGRTDTFDRDFCEDLLDVTG